MIQHPNGAAPTCHTVFATDRGCPWEKAKRLLDKEVRAQVYQGFIRGQDEGVLSDISRFARGFGGVMVRGGDGEEAAGRGGDQHTATITKWD